jgi:hypothetical protein
MKDIVYFIGAMQPEGELEFRYSLRSISKNLMHRRVVIIAPQVPDWVVGIDWIQWPQQAEKQLDISEKYKVLARIEDDMTDEVIVMDDDMYVVKPVLDVPLIFNTSLEAMVSIQENDYEKNAHGFALHNSLRLLRNHQIGWPLGASLHVPYPITRSEMPVHLEDGWGPYEWKSIWLNWATTQLGYKMKLINGDAKVMTSRELMQNLNSGADYLSSYEKEIEATHILTYLETEFPDPCPYEAEKT